MRLVNVKLHIVTIKKNKIPEREAPHTKNATVGTITTNPLGHGNQEQAGEAFAWKLLRL